MAASAFIVKTKSLSRNSLLKIKFVSSGESPVRLTGGTSAGSNCRASLWFFSNRGEQVCPTLPQPVNAASAVLLQRLPSVGLGESVDACGHHQLMLPDLPLQESLQLVDVHLRDDGPRGHEHPQHGVDAVQRHAVQVGQHGLDVGPEQLWRQEGAWSRLVQVTECVCDCACVCVCARTCSFSSLCSDCVVVLESRSSSLSISITPRSIFSLDEPVSTTW